MTWRASSKRFPKATRVKTSRRDYQDCVAPAVRAKWAAIRVHCGQAERFHQAVEQDALL